MTHPPLSALRRVLVVLDGTIAAEQAIRYARAVGSADATIDLLELTAAEAYAGDDPIGAVLAPAHRVDLIAIAGHLRDPITRLPIAPRIAGDAPAPVLVVHEAPMTLPDEPAAFRRILAPVDGSAHTPGLQWAAANLSARLGLPVHLLTVVDPAQAIAPDLAIDAMMAGAFADELAGALDNEGTRVLDEASASLARAGVAATSELRHGRAVAVIRQIARASDIVVVAHRGHGHEQAAGLGTVAGALVRACPAPVLVLPNDR